MYFSKYTVSCSATETDVCLVGTKTIVTHCGNISTHWFVSCLYYAR